MTPLIGKLRLIISVLAATILLYPSTGQAEGKHPDSISSILAESVLIPVDEADQNPDFKTFRDHLLVAIDQKDLKFILAHLDDDIQIGFGGHKGIDDFLGHWELKVTPEDSRFWPELKEVVLLGGTFDNLERTSFTAPYLFTKFPDDFDPYFYSAVIHSSVYLRTKPDSTAAILDTLTYSIVKKISEPWRKQASWQKIETLPGITGYVESRNIRSPIDYRANFTKQESKWKMTSFLAGD